MEPRRWLLPFTYGVNMQAIDSAVRLAESGEVTLVAASLVSVPQEARSRGVRLEHIQQSKDFLEAVKWKAARFEVPTERYEVFTVDVMQSIATLTRDLHCDSIVLVTRREEDVLLQANEVKRLLIEPPASLVLIRLPEPAHRAPLGARLQTWLYGLLGLREDARPVEEEQAVEGPSWIRMEEHHRG